MDKKRYLPVCKQESIEELCHQPAAFDVTTWNESAERDCSFTTYEQLMRNCDQAHKTTRTSESLVELAGLPALNDETLTERAKAPTVNKKIHSASSYCDLREIPDISISTATSEDGFRRIPASNSSDIDVSLRNSDYAYYPGQVVTPSNSDYAYYPPVLKNSDYVIKATSIPTNSSYCYVNEDGSSRLGYGCQQKSPTNPYVNVSRYRMDRPTTPTPPSYMSVGSAPIPSGIWTGLYEKEAKPPRAQQNATLNKKMRTAGSEADLARLNISFAEHCSRSGECVNCRLMSVESRYELQQIPSFYDFDLERFRDYSLQSLEDLRLLPSISSYRQTDGAPEQDVFTACSINSQKQDEPEKDVCTACSIRSDDNLKYFPEATRRE